MKDLNSVQQFYKDKTIFITGALGLMGKVLVEKLLYSCSNIKEIIILIRPKRGKTEEQRFAELSRIPLFGRICREKPDVMSKIIPVFGDITKPNLGLNEIQLAKVLQSNLVFHVAASLRLEYSLKPNVTLNLVGTKNVVDVSKKMSNLILMIHFSTGFCCPDQEVLKEEIVEWTHESPYDVIKLCEWLNEDALATVQLYLLREHPNTYTYTKRLAEILCRDEYKKGFPVCIVRPSIIIPAYQEPLVGYIDSMNGPAGLMIGAAKGVIRSMLADANTESEAIPVDIAINGIILIAKIVATQERSSQIEVYNVTASDKKKRKLGYVLEAAKKMNYEIPLSIGLWYPDGEITTNKLKHKINVFLFHWLPAYFIDFFMLCLMQKRFMIKIQTRISQGLDVLQFFTMRNWTFKSEKFKAINMKLSQEEYQMFFIDTEMIPDSYEEEFIRNCLLGGRMYILKEPISNIPKARIQMKIAYVVDRVCKFLFAYFLIIYVLRIFGLMPILGQML